MLPASTPPVPASSTAETAWDIGLAAAEGRPSPRHVPDIPCWVRFKDRSGHHLGTGFLRDLSLFGAGLVLNRPLPSGSTVSLLPLRRRRGKVAPVLCRIDHATPAGDRWLCGCDFIQLLDDGELEHWLS